MLDINHHLLHRKLQALGNGLNDTHIGLVRNDPLDVILIQTIAFSNESTIVAHVRHCIAEHGATLLIEVMQAVVDGEVTGRTDRTSSLDVQERQALAVSTKV